MDDLFAIAARAVAMLKMQRNDFALVSGFFRCDCGKLHMHSPLNSTCPQCKRCLCRYVQRVSVYHLRVTDKRGETYCPRAGIDMACIHLARETRDAWLADGMFVSIEIMSGGKCPDIECYGR